MKTFLMLDRLTSTRTVPLEYRPLTVTVGDQRHTLALHRFGRNGDWLISDPITGGGIARVGSTYKGTPVSSKDLGVREATAEARSTVAQQAHRYGLAEWNARLAAARARYAP
jgi:hypothetical protein